MGVMFGNGREVCLSVRRPKSCAVNELARLGCYDDCSGAF